MRKIYLAAAAAAMVLAGEAQAQKAKAPKPPSPFLLCDGATGHVGTGEMLGRLLALTATAGLSEAVTKKDDVNKRAKGREGVEACQTALAAEGQPVRRMQLGIARTIHYIEADDFDGAIASAREIPSFAAERASEWAIVKTAGSTALYLEAYAQLKAGRIAEAEDAALRSADAAGTELMGAVRASRLIGLTPVLSERKRAFYQRLAPLSADYLVRYAEALAWAGDYAGASQAIADYGAVATPFYKDKSTFPYDAMRSVYAVMAGDLETARTLSASARIALDKALADGTVNSTGSGGAFIDELLAFTAVGLALADGKEADARAVFVARGKWLQTSQPAVFDLAAKLRRGLPGKGDGLLAEEPAALREALFKARAAAAAKPSDDDTLLYRITRHIVSDGDYRRNAGNVWRVVKPRFLMKKGPKSSPDYEIVTTIGYIYDVTAGEALMLHSALTARSRGLKGFAFMPRRESIQTIMVRFGNPGEAGFPKSATFDAEQVIAALSPHIPQPPEKR